MPSPHESTGHATGVSKVGKLAAKTVPKPYSMCPTGAWSTGQPPDPLGAPRGSLKLYPVSREGGRAAKSAESLRPSALLASCGRGRAADQVLVCRPERRFESGASKGESDWAGASDGNDHSKVGCHSSFCGFAHERDGRT